VIFAAIDFETSHEHPDSACAVAVVRHGDPDGPRFFTSRICPPPRDPWMFERIHGLSRSDCAAAPWFKDVWPAVEAILAGADAVWAHNAPFDRRVLEASLRAARLPVPRLRWRCTVDLARRTWPRAGSYHLDAVCRYLGIPLDRHHDPLCDAEACAQIVLASRGERIGSKR